MSNNKSSRMINLEDIQGNVVRAYGRYSFPVARYFFLNFTSESAGRAFVRDIGQRVTTAARWGEDNPKPLVTLNIGFTFPGLYRLGVPSRTLQRMPNDFIDGMKARAHILGDRHSELTEEEDKDWCAKWDPLWRDNRSGAANSDVHAWLSMNAQVKPGTDQAVDALAEQEQWLRGLCEQSAGKVRILGGQGQQGEQDVQTASAVFAELPDGIKLPTPKEHFGFTDGIGDPVFKGQYPPEQEATRKIGRGKLEIPRPDAESTDPLEEWQRADIWEPIETGEFILGHPDEAQELPPSAVPVEFVHNGSFMVYRKLHENVGSFREVVDEEVERFAAVMQLPLEEARETLLAKMVGRWSDGVPLARVPTYAEWRQFQHDKGFTHPDPIEAAKAYRSYLSSPESSAFLYGDDMAGVKCPSGAHLRRVNPRDYLDPDNKPAPAQNMQATTQLNKRRRILRRGLPYGESSLGSGDDNTEQGVIFMVLCANISRQFEFVQQQWIQYGLDFNLGNDTCPLLGGHDRHKRHVISAGPDSGKPMYVMNKLKTFVETRGGDYFFIPSLTALRMIGMGVIDPT